jgi:putative DeoR family transcriptional regulator (stage III sporulation protein D)
LIEKRIIDEAYFIIEHGSTVRSAAKVFSVSKSTVHKDVSERLKDIDFELYKQVKKVLSINFSEKHLRGGLATKAKYARKKSFSQSKL